MTNLFQKIKLFVEAESWKLDYFKYVKFNGYILLFSFKCKIQWLYSFVLF